MPTKIEVVWTNGVKEEYDAVDYSRESHGLIMCINTKYYTDRIPMINVMRIRMPRE